MTDVKAEAVRLREKGHTYKQISEALNGVLSVDQCKRFLKGVVVNSDDKKCLEELIVLASRPQGITNYQATGIVYKFFEEATQGKVKYMKEKAKKQNPNCLFHAGWIDPSKAVDSHKSLCALVLHISDEVDSLVEDYLVRYPGADKWAVKNEILKLSFSDKMSVEPLSIRIARNEQLVELMESRNTKESAPLQTDVSEEVQ